MSRLDDQDPPNSLAMSRRSFKISYCYLVWKSCRGLQKSLAEFMLNCWMMLLVIASGFIVNEIAAGWSHYWESGDLRRVVGEFFDNDTKVGDCSYEPLLVIGQWLLDHHTWSLTMLTCCYSGNYETGWMCKYHHWTIGTWILQELFEIRDKSISFCLKKISFLNFFADSIVWLLLTWNRGSTPLQMTSID